MIDMDLKMRELALHDTNNNLIINEKTQLVKKLQDQLAISEDSTLKLHAECIKMRGENSILENKFDQNNYINNNQTSSTPSSDRNNYVTSPTLASQISMENKIAELEKLMKSTIVNQNNNYNNIQTNGQLISQNQNQNHIKSLNDDYGDIESNSTLNSPKRTVRPNSSDNNLITKTSIDDANSKRPFSSDNTTISNDSLRKFDNNRNIFSISLSHHHNLTLTLSLS
jgi:hypothetical protein